MWAAKLPGEGAKMYEACKAMCDIMSDLSIAVDGGKDSLSMAARIKGARFVFLLLILVRITICSSHFFLISRRNSEITRHFGHFNLCTVSGCAMQNHARSKITGHPKDR